MKKIIYSLIAVALGGSFLNISFGERVYANCNSTFFGLPSWCRGLSDGDGNFKFSKEDTESIPKFIWTVVGNLADGVFRIIGVISMVFIIWGGYQYMFALGESGKVGKAKTTISNAIIGLIISVSASIIVNFVLGIV